MADSKKLQALKVGGNDSGDLYTLDGKPVDMSSDKKGDQGVIEAIKTYNPNKGEYHYNPEDNVITPAGDRAGTGDTGMFPGSMPSRRAKPADNSYDEIGRKASEETEIAMHSPGAGVTDDKGYEAQEKEREKAEAEQAKAEADAAAEREKAAAR